MKFHRDQLLTVIRAVTSSCKDSPFRYFAAVCIDWGNFWSSGNAGQDKAGLFNPRFALSMPCSEANRESELPRPPQHQSRIQKRASAPAAGDRPCRLHSLDADSAMHCLRRPEARDRDVPQPRMARTDFRAGRLRGPIRARDAIDTLPSVASIIHQHSGGPGRWCSVEAEGVDVGRNQASRQCSSMKPRQACNHTGSDNAWLIVATMT